MSAVHATNDVFEGPAALSQAVRLWPCWKTVADEFDQFTYEDWYEEFFAAEAALEGHRLVVASAGDAVVGYAWGYVAHLGEPDVDRTARALDPEVAAAWLGDHFEVSSLGVHPDHWRRGVGRSLHDELLRGCRRRGVMVTWAMGDPDYTFCARLGWRRLGQLFPGLHVLGREPDVRVPITAR